MNKLIYLCLGLLFGLILGVFGWRTFDSSTEMTSEQHVAPPVAQAPCDTHDLSEAKTLYEKAFILFLANLGLKMTSEQKVTMDGLLQDPKTYLADHNSPVTPREDVINEPEAKTRGGEEHYDTKKNRPKDLKLPPEANKVVAAGNDFILKKPLSYYEDSKYLEKMDWRFKRINGSFEGKLYIVQGERKGEIDQVDLSVDFSINQQRNIEGTFFLQMAREGSVYSTSEGNGSNHNIRIHPEDKKSIILEASPNSFFHFRNEGMEVANYYAGGQFVGVAQFVRK